MTEYYLISKRDFERIKNHYKDFGSGFSAAKGMGWNEHKRAVLSKTQMVSFKETILGNEFNLPEGTRVRFLFESDFLKPKGEKKC